MMSVGGQLKVTPVFGVQLLFYKKYFYKISIQCGPCDGTFIRFQHQVKSRVFSDVKTTLNKREPTNVCCCLYTKITRRA